MLVVWNLKSFHCKLFLYLTLLYDFQEKKHYYIEYVASFYLYDDERVC